MAAFHHNGNVEVAKEAMSRTRDAMRHLYSLNAIPDELEDGFKESKEALMDQEVDADASKPLAGESVTYWAISDPEVLNAVPIPLPDWFQLPIDHVLLTWKRENEIWESRIQKRHEQGKEGLAPKTHQAYGSWLAAVDKVLILDKQKKAVVKNPSSRSERTLKKKCLMLVVHPSNDVNNLWIKAGNGKKWNLRLLRGQVAVDASVPAEVDHFSGISCSKNLCVCSYSICNQFVYFE